MKVSACWVLYIKAELKEMDSINKIFDLIGDHCASFLNYTIYQSILDKYCGGIECDEFNYPNKLKAYVKEHSIEELLKSNSELKKFSPIFESKDPLQISNQQARQLKLLILRILCVKSWT